MNTSVTQQPNKESSTAKATAPSAQRVAQPQTATPPIDVYEGANGIVVVVDLPGVEEKDLHLTIAQDVLTLTAERRANSAIEQAVIYKRSFVVPDSVDADAVEAKLENGELTIDLPRRREAKPRQIPIGGRKLS